jgi:hypothetical protein
VLNDKELSAAIGSPAYGTEGDKIGTVEHFFVDDRTGAPTWVAVSTGLFGTRHSVVPALEATFAEGGLRLPVPKDAVRSAPHVPDTGHLDPATEAELRRHYGLESGPGPAVDTPSSPGRTEAVPVGAVTGGTEPPGPVAVPEHEVAAARRDPGGRVRLVRYVVTEEVQVTVPIRREEVRLEELPLEGDAQPVAHEETLVPADAGVPDEIVLHAERPVVTVEVVPVERVRLRTEEVTGQERVGDRLQREQIVVDRS